METRVGIEPASAAGQAAAYPLCHLASGESMDMTDTDSGVYMMNWQQEEKVPKSGAGNEARTRDLNLGKVALYRLSYSRPLICAKNLFTICSERLSAKGRSAGTGAYLIYVRIPSTARYRLTGAQ